MAVPLQVLPGSDSVWSCLSGSNSVGFTLKVSKSIVNSYATANVFNDQIWPCTTHAPMCNHTRPGCHQDVDRPAFSIISPITLLAEWTTITDHALKMNPQPPASLPISVPCSTGLADVHIPRRAVRCGRSAYTTLVCCIWHQSRGVTLQCSPSELLDWWLRPDSTIPQSPEGQALHRWCCQHGVVTTNRTAPTLTSVAFVCEYALVDKTAINEELTWPCAERLPDWWSSVQVKTAL